MPPWGRDVIELVMITEKRGCFTTKENNPKAGETGKYVEQYPGMLIFIRGTSVLESVYVKLTSSLTLADHVQL